MASSQEHVTVVVPYYNERENLPYLLQQLAEQTLPPYEVILVDSGGNDGSSQVIDEWIAAQQPGIRFRNLHASTTTPGGSKSAGVKVSQGNLFAFMDCGLSFPKDWLERQVTALQRDDVDWASGVCLTKGTSLVDKAAIAHTYGYMTARPVIPGSVVRRRVFDRIGLFKDLRAGYDAEWARAASNAGLRRYINDDVVVEYRGVNFAADLSGVFLKSLRYARPSVGRDDTVVPYVYLLGSLLGVVVLVLSASGTLPVEYSVGAVIAYLFGRTIIASHKSANLSFFLKSPVRVSCLLLTGISMDLGKAAGFISGIVLRHVMRRRIVK